MLAAEDLAMDEELTVVTIKALTRMLVKRIFAVGVRRMSFELTFGGLVCGVSV